jgi:hypothetical protein
MRTISTEGAPPVEFGDKFGLGGAAGSHFVKRSMIEPSETVGALTPVFDAFFLIQSAATRRLSSVPALSLQTVNRSRLCERHRGLRRVELAPAQVVDRVAARKEPDLRSRDAIPVAQQLEPLRREHGMTIPAALCFGKNYVAVVPQLPAIKPFP